MQVCSYIPKVTEMTGTKVYASTSRAQYKAVLGPAAGVAAFDRGRTWPMQEHAAEVESDLIGGAYGAERGAERRLLHGGASGVATHLILGKTLLGLASGQVVALGGRRFRVAAGDMFAARDECVRVVDI